VIAICGVEACPNISESQDVFENRGSREICKGSFLASRWMDGDFKDEHKDKEDFNEVDSCDPGSAW
jgi:hypothetical protein